MGGITRRRQSVEYVELLPTAKDVNSNAGWVEWDLTAIVPNDAKYMSVLMSPMANAFCGVRELGSGLSRVFSIIANESFSIDVAIINGKCEVYDGSVSHTYYTMCGYIK